MLCLFCLREFSFDSLLAAEEDALIGEWDTLLLGQPPTFEECKACVARLLRKQCRDEEALVWDPEEEFEDSEAGSSEGMEEDEDED